MSLSTEQIKAIAGAMTYMPVLNSLHLEDTNLTDFGFSLILRSIEINIKPFRSITYKGVTNAFGELSLRELDRILQRKVPF